MRISDWSSDVCSSDLDATPLVVDICVNIDQFRQARHGLLYLWQPLFKQGQFAAQQAVVVRARTVLAPPHKDVLLRYQCQARAWHTQAFSAQAIHDLGRADRKSTRLNSSH